MRLALCAEIACARRYGMTMSHDYSGATMNVVILSFEASLEPVFRMILECAGYDFATTTQPDEAFHALESSDGSCILVTDNVKVNPVIYSALTALNAQTDLRQRVRVIGVDTPTVVSEQYLAAGLLDAFIAMPFSPADVIDAITASGAQRETQSSCAGLRAGREGHT